MRKIFIVASFAAVLLSSCTREINAGLSGEGGLRLGISLCDETKAAMTDQELIRNSIIKIYNGDFSGLVRQYKFSQAPEVIYLPVESYRLDAVLGEASKENPAAASWEQKSYSGSANFTIVAGAETNVQVEAGISNAVTEVSFDNTVSANFRSGYSFTIGLDASDAARQLTYTAGNSGAKGYFLPEGFEPSIFWKFTGILDKTGEPFEKSGEIANVEKGKLYRMKPTFTVREGSLSFDLLVDYDVDIISDIIIFEPLSTGLSASRRHEIWAGHATVHADIDESEYGSAGSIRFAYSSDGKTWMTVDAVRESEGVYSAVISSLTPGTAYSYKLVIDGEDIGDAMSFTTDAAPQLPNSGFEITSNDESSKWVSFYAASSSAPECRTKFWDHGSSASAGLLGASYAICYSDTNAPSGIGSTKSARLQSISAAGKLAAGNLFTGEYAETVGMNGKVNFGRPWTSRPTAVRFWYKYKGGKVDKTASGCPLTTSDYDVSSIKIALGTWTNKKYGGSPDSPVQVYTADTRTFWNYPDLPETIAYAEFNLTGNGGTSEWKQVTVPLEYLSTTAFPSHIVVSCAASKYGDYFAGSSSSALWLDNFELLYE